MSASFTNRSAAHKEPYVWLIWALLGSVIVACSVTIYLAVHSNDGLVTKDYYKEGLGINQSLSAYQTAAQQALSAELTIQNNQLLIRVDASKALPLQDNLELLWFHPTDAKQDSQLPLMISAARIDSGAYVWAIPVNKLNLMANWSQQRWYVMLSSIGEQQAAWKLRGTWAANSGLMRLQP